jgi:hypothetical protein
VRPEHQTILLDWYGPQRHSTYESCLSAGNRPQAHQAQNKRRSAEYFAWHNPLLINEAVRRRCCCRIVDRRVVSSRATAQTGNHRLPMLIRDHLVCRFARAYWAARKSSGRLRLNRALARFRKQWPMSTSRPRALAAGGERSNWDSGRDHGAGRWLLVGPVRFFPIAARRCLYGPVRPLIACNRYIVSH